MDHSEHHEIAPELRRLLRQARFLPGLERFAPKIARLFMALLGKAMVPRSDSQVDETIQQIGPDRLTVRIFRPRGSAEPQPALLYLHGGGWTIGSSAESRPFTALLAEQASCVVYSLDYRLAPEHPFPQQLNDVGTAWEWLQQHHPRADEVPLMLGGDSAGATLATVVCRRLRDEGQRQPDGQFLIYPVTSTKQQTASYQRYGHGLILTRGKMDYFLRHYIGQVKDPAANPDISPLHANDLSRLPPTFMGLAAADILHDEGIAYAQALRQAGVPVEMQVFPDMIHAFVNLLAIPAAYESAAVCAKQLQQLIQRTSNHAPRAH